MSLLKTLGTIGLAVLASSCTLTGKKEPVKTLHLTSLAVKTLDPALADDVHSANQVGMVYEGLLQYHYLKRPYALVPNLAESMPEISSDRKTLTFRLKKGTLFQDSAAFKETEGKGRELVAADVVYSFKRIADPKLKSPGWWIFDDRIVGLNAWREAVAQDGANYSTEVEGLRALDRYTVQIRLTRPSPRFLSFLAMSYASIVPREVVEHSLKDFAARPVGTGPFRLDQWTPGSKLVWVKSPLYRKELYPSEGEVADQKSGLLTDSGQALPLVERVVVGFFQDTQSKWSDFVGRKLDLIELPKDNYAGTITPGKELNAEFKAKGISLVKSQRFDVSFESFNMNDPIVGKNRLLRQAISLAVNQDSLIDLFYNGRATPAQGPIPPGMTGFEANYKNPFRQFNLGRAKELLARAGYPAGRGLTELRYAAPEGGPEKELANFIVESLKALHVPVAVKTYSSQEFEIAVRQGKVQLWSGVWAADYPDPESFFALFYGKNIASGPNYTRYSNPEFDRLYERVHALGDGSSAAKETLYQQMTEILAEDCPWIFGVHRVSYFLLQPRLKNFKPHPFDIGAAKYYGVVQN